MARSFAEKLDRLFTTIRRPDGSAYSLSEVAASVNEQGDTKLSASYLSELRSGRKDNPNIWVANALARFFGQPIEYFIEDELEPVQPGARARPAVGDLDLETLAGRLNNLIALTAPHGVREPSDEQLARWMQATGVSTTPEQLGELRSGEEGELSSELATAIASFFDVPVAFLIDQAVAEAMAPQLRLMRVMADQGLRRLAMRANDLKDEDRQRVADLVERLASDRGARPGELDF